HEEKYPSGLPLHHGPDERWNDVPDPVDLWLGGRDARSRHRPDHTPGLDGRRPADPRPRWPREPLQQEVRLHQIRLDSPRQKVKPRQSGAFLFPKIGSVLFGTVLPATEFSAVTRKIYGEMLAEEGLHTEKRFCQRVRRRRNRPRHAKPRIKPLHSRI